MAFAIWREELYASVNFFSENVKANDTTKLNIEHVIKYFRTQDFSTFGTLPKFLLENLISNSRIHQNMFYEDEEEKENLMAYMSEYFYENDPQEFAKHMGVSDFMTDMK